MAGPKGAETRLATYGTLAPGRANHHHLAELDGCWQRGWVTGVLRAAGWGARQGFPGFSLDPDGREIEVMIFQSDELPAHWARLDSFEGADYRRQVVRVRTEAGFVEASIYALADERHRRARNLE